MSVDLGFSSLGVLTCHCLENTPLGIGLVRAGHIGCCRIDSGLSHGLLGNALTHDVLAAGTRPMRRGSDC